MLRELVQDEASPDGVGEKPVVKELAPGVDESPKSADNHADALGQMLRELVQEEASPDGVGEQYAGQEQAPAERGITKGGGRRCSAPAKIGARGSEPSLWPT